MASAFSHIAVPIALRMSAGKKIISWRLFIFALFVSVAPDLDSIAFKFGIPYESQWGHRGFSHSIFFAAIIAGVATLFSSFLKSKRPIVFFITFLSMISHGVLDAMTTGGLGIAFFWPFKLERYFLPWQVIEVSPLSIRRFFSERGLAVLISEFIYVWLPCLAFGFTAQQIGNRLKHRRFSNR